MNDETFRIELLSRLDLITDLLTSSLPEACLEEPETGPFHGMENAAEPGAPPSDPLYSIDDEMRDNYELAVRRWRQANSTL